MYQPVSNGKKKGVNGFNINVGTTLPESVFAEIEAVARTQGLPIAGVLRQLALRGLAAYRQDLQLAEPVENIEVGMQGSPGEIFLTQYNKSPV